MAKTERVAGFLNEVLRAELTSAHQCFLHSVMCGSWGFAKLAAHLRTASVCRMSHAQMCVEQILLRHGTPEVQELFPIRVGLKPTEQIENDLAMSVETIARLREAMAVCAQAEDRNARDVFQKILMADENDIDFFEAELYSIRELGIDEYRAAQVN